MGLEHGKRPRTWRKGAAFALSGLMRVVMSRHRLGISEAGGDVRRAKPVLTARRADAVELASPSPVGDCAGRDVEQLGDLLRSQKLLKRHGGARRLCLGSDLRFRHDYALPIRTLRRNRSRNIPSVLD